MKIVYTVHCKIKNSGKVEPWLAWLKDPHIADVMAGGAQSAEIVRMDGAENSFQVRYIFENRAAFERYEAEFAPKLREEGLALFPPEDGFEYSRSSGEIMVSR